MLSKELLARLPAVLLPWYNQVKRDLPWRADREPYHVWLSEIMLQQTRVEAVRGYYLRFLAALPDISALAEASKEQLLKLWEGLGYYSRVRQLGRAARVIMEVHGGSFPHAYTDIRSLPGIGDYTAGAIASICFGQPEPAVDGNVLRVVSRICADDTCVDLPATKAAVRAALAEIYPVSACGDFTQALMELGATVCIPRGEPRCALCPCASFCRAYAEGRVNEYPVRSAKRARRIEERTVFLLRHEGRIAIAKRPARGLLAGLWELPNLVPVLSPNEALARTAEWGCAPRNLIRELHRTHVFTHIEWQMTAYEIDCAEIPDRFVWADVDELTGRYALPSAFRLFLEEK